MTLNAIEIAQLAAKGGAEVLLRYWMNLGKEDAALKARNDWVSAADRESEQTIIDIIQKHSPADTILGEESGNVASKKGSSQRSWVIDPLDGTSNYLQHFPFWCISIGIRDEEQVTGAVIYEPLREQMFVAEKGKGAFLNGERIHVSTHTELEGAFLATGFPFRAQKHVATYTQVFGDVISVVKGVRRAGSAALDLAYTAAGIFDGFFELHLAPWDVAAGSLLVREAGGVVSDFSGGDQFWERGNIIGAAPGVHEKLLRLIGRHTDESQLDR